MRRARQVGTLVGCLRRQQQWSLVSTLDEYRSFAAPTPRVFCEQFVELWDTDLVTLPQALPAWFIAQQQMLDEDTAETKCDELAKDRVRNGPDYDFLGVGELMLYLDTFHIRI